MKSKKVKVTRKEYEEFMNGFCENEFAFILGGKFRKYYFEKQKLGTALRKHDPINFEVGYHDYVRFVESQTKNIGE